MDVRGLRLRGVINGYPAHGITLPNPLVSRCLLRLRTCLRTFPCVPCVPCGSARLFLSLTLGRQSLTHHVGKSRKHHCPKLPYKLLQTALGEDLPYSLEEPLVLYYRYKHPACPLTSLFPSLHSPPCHTFIPSLRCSPRCVVPIALFPPLRCAPHCVHSFHSLPSRRFLQQRKLTSPDPQVTLAAIKPPCSHWGKHSLRNLWRVGRMRI